MKTGAETPQSLGMIPDDELSRSAGKLGRVWREMVRDAVHCHFNDGVPSPMPKITRLHFVRDEALAV